MSVLRRQSESETGDAPRSELSLSRRRLRVVAPPIAAEEPGTSAVGAPSQRPSAARGSLVAVCGLCGGAGASTLAYLIARSAVDQSPSATAPVLLLDAGGATGGLSLCTQTCSRRSLTELAADIRAGRAMSAPMFAVGPGGVRVIASAPRPQPESDPGIVLRILADARDAHRMTVVDCGTLSLPAERLALEGASHVVWVLPATEHGVDRAEQSPWSVGSSDVVQMLLARHDPSAAKASMRSLTRLASEREASLVLMPHVKNLKPTSLDVALEICGVTLDALATKLRL